MWCSACHQDVPGVAASVHDATMCCARCGKALGQRSSPAEEVVTPVEALVPTSDGESDESGLLDLTELGESPDFVEVDEWDFEETLSNAERLVRTVQAQDRAVDALWSARPAETEKHGERADQIRIDAGTTSAEDLTTNESTSVPLLVLALGLAVFVCGAILAGWSLLGHGENMWRLGVPMVMGGQVAMLAGLMWQLEAVWQSNRETRKSVETLDQQLKFIRRRAAFDSSPSHDGRAFYRHLAENASPHILLADLKGQLDTLSHRLAGQSRNNNR